MTRVVLCLDVDGTLIDPGGELFPGAAKLIQDCRQRCLVGLCSGRPTDSLAQVAVAVGGCDFVVGLQGAHAIALSPEASAIAWVLPLGEALSSTSRALLEVYGQECWYYDHQGWYVREVTRQVQVESKLIGMRARQWRHTEFSQICKMAAVAKPDRIDALSRALSGSGELLAMRSQPHMLEMVSGRVGPAKGVTRVKKGLGGKGVRVLAAGDSENDLEMLRLADSAWTFSGSRIADRFPTLGTLPHPREGGLDHLRAAILSRI